MQKYSYPYDLQGFFMASYIEPHQHTLNRPVSCCGIGLHTGKPVNMTLKPAAPNTGIRFHRSDLHSDF